MIKSDIVFIKPEMKKVHDNYVLRIRRPRNIK